MKINHLLVFFLLINAYSRCAAQQQQPNADTESIKTSINNFFEWYKLNIKTIQQSDIVNGPNSIFVVKTVGSLSRPAINTIAVEKHIAVFKSSNSVSAIFLNTLRKHYKEMEKVMKELKPAPAKKLRTDTIVVNLDMLFGFDLEEVLNNYQAGIYNDIYIKNTKAVTKFFIEDHSNEIQFTLSKIKNRWMIDDIKYIE